MENIFALDIGTRVVVGLLMKKAEQGYEIISSSITEHTQRAMYDGQVHDVDEVAKAVKIVKDELEIKSNCSLKHVSVAAAGRALRTVIATAKKNETIPVCWEKEEVLALEMEAVQKALKNFANKENKYGSSQYCVGYNTIEQFLEGDKIASLIGQRGREIEVGVIATFLPRTVIDGLLAVLARCDLEMSSLTLEPIAAGQAAIPYDMRRLNLALVDIGAGTADIALTKNGSFFSYGMVPMAGDEVTEAICSHYLLEFQEGERIKKNLQKKSKISVSNFFGEKVIVNKKEILEIIKPTVESMAKKICNEIIVLNRQTPQAVILIGGGSLTPMLPELLSELMEIPQSRVGIQIRERISNVWGEKNLTGPDVITPIGIGMSALESKGLHYYSVFVNDIPVSLFELQLATVAEVLLAAGIQPKSFIGKPGTALTYDINGDIHVIKGEMGTSAKLVVNSKPCNLDQKLKPGDCVNFVKGKDGKDAIAQIKDVLAIPEQKIIYWNGKEEILEPMITMNSRVVNWNDYLVDGCKLVLNNSPNISDIMKLKGYNLNKLKNINFKVNGKNRQVESEIKVCVNEKQITEDYIVNNKDKIELIDKKIPIKDINLTPTSLRFIVNKKEFELPPRKSLILHRGKEVSGDVFIEEGMELTVKGFSQRPILSELFPYLSLKENNTVGSQLIMTVNGKKAEFTTELNQGDIIVVKWGQ